MRSTKEQVDAEFYLLFPHFDPARMNADLAKFRAAEAARRAAMTEDERAAEDERNRRRAAKARKDYERMQDKSYDANGWVRGDKVAQKVDLNDHTKVAEHQRKGIE